MFSSQAAFIEQMNILFLTDNFFPEVNAPASRTFEHCREWAKKPGCTVTVITCVPNFPNGKVFKGYANKLFQVETIAGIRVIRVWSYISPNQGSVRRVLDYLSFMLMAVVATIFVRRVDVIVATSPQFFTACAGFLGAWIKRCPWIFELRDIWPESIRVVGAMDDGVALRLVERLELFLYRKANRIVSVTHAFKNSLGRRGIDTAKIDVVTNGVDLSKFTPIPKDQVLLSELDLHGKFVAGYIGTHGLAHGLDSILDAACKLQLTRPQSDITFLFLGDGAEKKSLLSRAQALELKNVIFLDSVGKDEVSRYWSILDVAIIHLQRQPLFETVIPSKIFECMGMGLPMAHGVQGESADIVNAAGAGITFQSENPEDLLRVLAKMEEDTELRENLSVCGVRAAKEFDRANLADRMYKILLNAKAGAHEND